MLTPVHICLPDHMYVCMGILVHVYVHMYLFTCNAFRKDSFTQFS